MADKKDSISEIRIIKRGRSRRGHHGGAWKVAYADFVTAMMVFFLVMWITGLSNEVKQAIAAYFKDPVGFMTAVQGGKSPFKTPGVTESKGGKGMETKTVVNDTANLAKAKQSIDKMIQHSPEFKKLKDSIDVHLVDEGLQIDLIDGKENLFFDSGSAKVKPATEHLLSEISVRLSQLNNKLIIEGHTDKHPLSTRAGYTNWELSADRANAARTLMEGDGLRPDQVDQVRGYAATHPRNKDPYHYSNRRVSIIVMFNRVSAKDEIAVDQNNASSAIDESVKTKTQNNPAAIDVRVGPTRSSPDWNLSCVNAGHSWYPITTDCERRLAYEQSIENIRQAHLGFHETELADIQSGGFGNQRERRILERHVRRQSSVGGHHRPDIGVLRGPRRERFEDGCRICS